MQATTLTKYTAYTHNLAQLNGVPAGTQSFAVAPTIEQKLEDRLRDSVEFLRLVNSVGVRDLKGERVGLGVGGSIASRTDTNAADRTTSDPSALSAKLYELHKTNYDTHIRYNLLDTWSKFPDFEAKLRDHILHQQGLDRIKIGFNGASAAATTNRTTNPLLQDVNIGWLQAMRDYNSGVQVMDEGAEVGAAATYKNLDALVYDAWKSIIDEQFHNTSDLVVVCSSATLHSHKMLPLTNTIQPASEILAAATIMGQSTLGGLRVVTAPYFPDNTVLVTALDNLSIYWQDGSRRRTVLDNPKRDRVEDYQSVNEGYVVEVEDAACLIENITFA